MERNYAFIDGQNLYKNILYQGWKIDYALFKEYLKNELGVTKAYVFLGYVSENSNLYNHLDDLGYTIIFKKTTKEKGAGVRGNCDADLVFRLCIEFWNFDKAILVSGDGDYYNTVEILLSVDKLKVILAPGRKGCSEQYLHLAQKNKLIFLSETKDSF